VVLTILKNSSQWEGLSHIFWKIPKMFETTNRLCVDDKSLFNPLPILDTLQKMTNSLLVNVDIPIDTKRLKF